MLPSMAWKFVSLPIRKPILPRSRPAPGAALPNWCRKQSRSGKSGRPSARPRAAEHTPAEAAARIRELRKGNILPAGATIKDLINYGRA